MSAISRRPEADPLYARPKPQRAAYATGMLLDAQDFADEQTYHRGRLARALLFGVGSGTLAGLEVTHRPASDGQAEEIQVAPGIAVDGIGRLVEIPRPACLRLARWFTGEAERDGGDTLRRAALGNLAALVGARLRPPGALPARAVVADVYLRFVSCENGLTPSFAAGPFDALDAVAPSRLHDAYELHLIARSDGLDVDNPDPTRRFIGLPDLGPNLAGTADISQRRAELQDFILAAYPVSGTAGIAGAIARPAGHPPDLDPTAVFLARVLIPVGPANPPQRTNETVRIDNFSRRFVPSATLLARWVGA
jgi:hypothetical protein